MPDTAMPDIATPNLPSRDFATTSAFYARLGFSESYRDEGWMILVRDQVMLSSSRSLAWIQPRAPSVAVCDCMTSTRSTACVAKRDCPSRPMDFHGCTHHGWRSPA